jgi:predicted DNA-binding protein with PD1-like motif
MKSFLSTITTVFFALGTVMTATSAMASEDAAISSAVVGKSSCGKLANTAQPFILVLNSGDNLLESITQCAKDAKLMGASISGLGQVHNPTLAYFTSNPNDKPTLTTFSGYYELAGFNGNITNNANQYYTHAHAVLADKQFHGIAGHVNAAKVGLTVEITIIPFPASVQRTVDPKTGFGPIVQ